MVFSEILFRIKLSYTLKCLLATNYQFRALSTKKNPVGDLSKYKWDKENCINHLQQVDDLLMVNYKDLAEQYSLQNDDGKYQLIWMMWDPLRC